MEGIAFTLVAVVLYLACDRLLLFVEARMGRRITHRTLVFFVMLMSAALIGFALIRRIAGI